VFLFIFESIGTSELILVGIVALIFLGPRKLPEMARKAGKIMSEFRGTANEFKQTWEREVNFEEEMKSLSLGDLDEDAVARDAPAEAATTTTLQEPPVVTTADPEKFKHLMQTTPDGEVTQDAPPPASLPEPVDENAKQNWL
jgi:Tat protein translocase TatB subunit